ncbi:MAG: hypothetical protein ACP5M4_07160 [Acidobacteriaceae bacterium]
MTEFTGANEVRERLDLIESMVLEGRRGTERWGWMFVLWGVAYYVAIVWTSTARFGWAWPITVIAAVIISAAIRRALSGQMQAPTAVGRAVRSMWVAFGISVFLLMCALGISQRLTDPHVVFAIIAGMLGMVNGASAMILRWKPQMACAVAWWAAAVACCYGNLLVFDAPVAFLAAVFLCQIVFGAYCMMLDTRKPRVQAQGMSSHA